MKIGVISDTHGYFDPAIPGLFDGVDHILHAGDIGPPKIIHELESIATVTAVFGNTDAPWPGLREFELVTVGGFQFLLQHIVDPARLSEVVQQRISNFRPRAVIFGHTHKPFAKQINGTLFFNPGSAGRSRFNLPRTAAVLHLDGDRLREQFLSLS